jgi:uncharacterized membrane protein YdjX (TVP38/TMEM64 family)
MVQHLDQARHMKAHQPRLYRWRVAFGLLFITVCLVCGILLFKNHAKVTSFVDDAGTLGMIWFVVGLSIAVMLLMPTPFLKMFAGAVFPYPIAVLVNFAGSMIGGIGAFVFGRWLFRDAILAAIQDDVKLKRIDAALGEESMRISILVRLSPLLPDELLNYMLAAGPVRLRTFILSNMASLVFCVVYAYYGWVIGEIALRESGIAAFQSSSAALWLLIAGVVASVVASVIVTRVTMKSLNDVMGDEVDPSTEGTDPLALVVEPRSNASEDSR